MSYSASLSGGNGETLPGGSIPPDADAYYRIEAADVFVDRFNSTGDSVVDAGGNPSGVRVDLGSGTDVVYGGSGADRVWAGAGNDTLYAGAGDNTVAGGAGNDWIESGGGRDSLVGGLGNDTFVSGAGNDYAAGGSGADWVEGNAGNDTLLGGSGADSLFGGAGNDSLTGGSGNDRLRGEAGNDRLLGGDGADSLYGEAGNDVLSGGSGADLLVGGAGDDALSGGSGRDVFAFDNGFGQDVISDFSLRNGDQINLATNLNGTGIQDARDLLSLDNPNVSVTGGTTAAGAKFTVITVGGDTIRLERVDYNDFVSQIDTWVKVG